MQLQGRLYTSQEYVEMTERPENEDRWLELLNGEIIEMPPPKSIHAPIAGRVFGYVFNFVEACKLGYVTPDGGGYELSATDVGVPDVAFISKGRARTGR